MAKNKPTEAELEILQVIWTLKSCSVKEVHEQISKKRDVGYTTTLKQMQRMLEKNLLEREDGKGKSHVYKATISNDSIKGSLFDGVLDKVFGNSVGDLVLHALGKGKASKEEIKKIKDFLDKLEGGQQ